MQRCHTHRASHPHHPSQDIFFSDDDDVSEVESRRVDATSGDEEGTEMGVIVKDKLKDPYSAGTRLALWTKQPG